jgi:hypothetical protein
LSIYPEFLACVLNYCALNWLCADLLREAHPYPLNGGLSVAGALPAVAVAFLKSADYGQKNRMIGLRKENGTKTP